MAPARIFISVLLPAPFSPQMECTSPAGATSETSRNARTPPKLLEMWSISRPAAPAPVPPFPPSASTGLVPWLMGGLFRQGHRVVDLPRDFDEPNCGYLCTPSGFRAS